MDRAEIMVLGPVRLRTAEGETAIAGGKLRLLTALLAAAGSAVSTSALVDELWVGKQPAAPGHALQNLVSRLRGLLGDPASVVHEADRYRLSKDHVGIDAARVERHLSEAAAALSAGRAGDARALLFSARRTWRGAAYADVPHGAMLAAEVSRLEGVRRRCLDVFFEASLATVTDDDVVDELLHLVAEDPLDERRRGQLMRALARSGRQAAALATYRDGVAALDEELGVRPGTELRAAHLEILRQAPARAAILAADVATQVPPPLAGLARQPLVGRDAEASEMLQAWSAAREGQPRFVVVQGEPGAGKSRLLAWLAAAVTEDDGCVLFGRCDEHLHVPFQPFVEALGRSLFETVPYRLGDDDGRRRQELFARVVTRLEEASRQSPTVLLIDDGHWATAPTLHMLRHVMRWLPPAPVLVVVAVRDRGYEPVPDTAAVLGEIRADPSVATLALGRLDLPAVRDLAVLHGHQPHVADDVLARTDGNAFLVTEIMRELTEMPNGPPTARGTTVPRRVDAMVAARRAPLSERAASVLEAAAVTGFTFDLQLVATAADSTGLSLAEALDENEVAGLIEPWTTSPLRYRFRHALVREAVVNQLTAIRRQVWHGRVGHALEGLVTSMTAGTPSLDDASADLAHHFFEAQDDDRAIRYGLHAAETARARLAWEDAASHYRRALEACDRRGDAEQRPALLLGQADAERRVGATGAALQTYRAAFEAASSSGTPTEVAVAALGFEDARAQDTYERHADESARLLDAAAAHLGTTESALGLAIDVRRVESECHRSGLSDDLRHRAASALARIRDLGDPALHAAALEADFRVNWTTHGLPRRLQLLREMEALALSRTSPERLRLRVFAASTHLEASNRTMFERERDAYRRDVAAAAEPWHRWWAGAFDGTTAALDGRLDDLEQVVADLGPGVSSPLQGEMLGLFGTALSFDLADDRRLAAAIDGWRAVGRTSQTPASIVEAALSLLHLLRRNADVAREHAERVQLATLARWPAATWAIGALGLAAAELEMDDTLGDVLEVLAPCPDRVLMMGALCPFTTHGYVLSHVALGLGDLDAAIEYAERATELHERLRAGGWARRSLNRHASLLRQRGGARDIAAADRLLVRASDIR